MQVSTPAAFARSASSWPSFDACSPAASWTEAEAKKLASGEQASKLGQLLAERAKAAGVETCIFDRGGYRYHGNVARLADAAREGGLQF